MKLLILSDLHIDYNRIRVPEPVVPSIASYIREMAPDRVVIAGDTGGGAAQCLGFLEEIEQQSGVPVSYVPGNHSIWSNSKETDSWHEYNLFRAHPTSLIDRPIHLNEDWVLLGDMGWYDYTFREEHIPLDQIRDDKSKVWKDSVLARFGLDDEALTDMMLDKFERMLEAHKDKQIVFVNHFVPYRHFVPVSPHSEIWNMIRPFIGSARIGELLDRYEQVRYVIFGHMHYRHGLCDFHDKKIICSPLGYAKKEWKTNSLEQELRDCGVLIEL